MIDHSEILAGHLQGVQLTEQERKDVEATFERMVRIGRAAVNGAEVDADLAHVQAQVALWRSGALSATQDAFWEAAKQYAEEAGELLGKVIKSAAGGLIG